MANFVAKIAAKKMLAGELSKYKSKAPGGEYDPYYDTIPHPRKPNKTKKVKKQIPAYIPPRDAEVLARARKRAYRLDYCLFNLFGVRFGWSSVIGLVPVAGDALDFGLAVRHVYKMSECTGGLTLKMLSLMMLNVLVDFLFGLIPFVGDLADANFKCNAKNVRILEEHLDKLYKPKELVDKDKEYFKSIKKKPRPATVYEDFSDEEDERRNDTSFESSGNVQQPEQAFSGRRERLRDEEMGLSRNKDTR
ncbi:uncharacterized protein EI97DRAFT_431511 [Westerdykella ornata]|uniref:PH domain-containing protein n=1 Tax=Westerdykella ornata TaxID=318751 RepID=A0A6A6JQ53_WESOR|nr:uncharacterized protein EI97DRAFT_431511 [Westerdykella ornata]KAF2278253.1 hypothetical protein EI97DRAFT_431511 [Westerdykella ornata]